MHASTSVRPDGAHHSHSVQLYDADATLLREVTNFIRTTLGTGACALVVATEPHRRDIDARLQRLSVDMDQVRREGRYLALDAASTLDIFTEGATVDVDRFHGMMGDLLQRMAGRSRNAQHPIGVFGEMVALLASTGRHTAAIELEHAWNRLAQVHPFSLQCGYPVDAFAQPGDQEALAQICATHSHIVPAESYSALENESHRLRALSLRHHDVIPVDRHLPPSRMILHDRGPGIATATATLPSPTEHDERLVPSGRPAPADQPEHLLSEQEIRHGLHAVIGMHGLPVAVHGDDGLLRVTCQLSPSWELVIQPGPVPLAIAYRGRLPERVHGASDRWAPLWALLASWGTKPEHLRPVVTTSRFFPEFLDNVL
jgi:hypothetical protein